MGRVIRYVRAIKTSPILYYNVLVTAWKDKPYMLKTSLCKDIATKTIGASPNGTLGADNSVNKSLTSIEVVVE